MSDNQDIKGLFDEPLDEDSQSTPRQEENDLTNPPKEEEETLYGDEQELLNEEPQLVEQGTDEQEQNSFLNADGDSIKSLPGMYKKWFLDYASYVILERAIPHIDDGLKPVQRRVLFAMHLLENGHLHKVAKIVGQTMAFHPHGDASINDALVQLGQKKLLLETQGNWGNILTGDEAAAGRYIEAKLSQFASDTLFDEKITQMKKSYDGTANEPVSLPVRFPLLLAMGAEGIAVGLSSKIYPHNPRELIDAAIAYLRGQSFTLYPDFPTGGLLDVDRYNDGTRGGVLKCRAKVERIGERLISITQLPYGKSTTTLIDSIIKAGEKGQIKIKHIDDMTAAQVDIRIQLPAGISTDKTIDGLFAFTDCEVSLSPNACVIKDNKPVFLGVSDILKYSVDCTQKHFHAQLSYRLDDIKQQHLTASLERIFIEERIYKEKQFEDALNETDAVNYVRERILSLPNVSFIAPLKKDDFKRLLDIKMARILRFNIDKHEKLIARLEQEIQELQNNLDHLVNYTIAYFEKLRDTYFAKAERQTQLARFSNIEATKVIEANEKLYIDREGGFAGTSLKNAEFVTACSSLDDLIVFFENGTMMVTKIEEKKFLGHQKIIHIDRYMRDNKRKIYNAVYRDGSSGNYYIKRFSVTGVIRDRKYDITYGADKSKIVYFSANPNGEAETIRITLKPRLKMRNLVFEKDFSNIPIRGRAIRGLLLTKAPIQKIALKEKGASTLGGRKVWFDKDVMRINFAGQGTYIDSFENNEQLLVLLNDGRYYTTEVSESTHFSEDTNKVEKFDANKVWSALYFNKENKSTYLKRFTLSESNRPLFIQGEGNTLLMLSDADKPTFELIYESKNGLMAPEVIDCEPFVGVKSVAAKGKRVSTKPLFKVNDLTQYNEVQALPNEEQPTAEGDDENLHNA